MSASINNDVPDMDDWEADLFTIEMSLINNIVFCSICSTTFEIGAAVRTGRIICPLCREASVRRFIDMFNSTPENIRMIALCTFGALLHVDLVEILVEDSLEAVANHLLTRSGNVDLIEMFISYTEKIISNHRVHNWTEMVINENSGTCSICLAPFEIGETAVTTACNHMFHSTCINEWVRIGRSTCPLCRSAI